MKRLSRKPRVGNQAPQRRWANALVSLAAIASVALLIALARLTLGLRVQGLRSILLAIGLQEIGELPSLALMFVVIAVIVVIRPAMTQTQTAAARTSVRPDPSRTR